MLDRALQCAHRIGVLAPPPAAGSRLWIADIDHVPHAGKQGVEEQQVVGQAVGVGKVTDLVTNLFET